MQLGKKIQQRITEIFNYDFKLEVKYKLDEQKYLNYNGIYKILIKS